MGQKKDKKTILREIRAWISKLTPEEAEDLQEPLDDLTQSILQLRGGWQYRIILNESCFDDFIDHDPDVRRLEKKLQSSRLTIQEIMRLERLLSNRYRRRILCIPDDFSFYKQKENPAKLVMGINGVIQSDFRKDGLLFVHSFIPYYLSEEEYELFLDDESHPYYMGYVACVRDGKVIKH